MLRVLHDHEPLTLGGLGELLVCETGSSPSRLVDRLVAQGLVQRQADPVDRRFVTLGLTAEAREVVRGIQAAERRLYDQLDRVTADQPVDAALEVLRRVADAFPVGEALARRRGEPGPS